METKRLSLTNHPKYLANKWALFVVFLIMVMALPAPGVAASVGEMRTLGSLSSKATNDLERLISIEVMESLKDVQLLRGQRLPHSVKVLILSETSEIRVELGSGFLPAERVDKVVMHDQFHSINTAVGEVVGYDFNYSVIRITFDGQDADHYFTIQRNASVGVSQKIEQRTESWAVQSRNSYVGISPGHGYYYDPVADKWELQRPDGSQGIFEDLFTPVLAGQLSNYISLRFLDSDGALNARRPLWYTEVHEDSQKPWWQISAREVFRVALPSRPDIWDAPTAASPANLINYRKDLNSRVLWANSVPEITQLVSLHTNASSGRAGRGTRLYVPLTGTQAASSAVMGKLILCHMKELINAQTGLESFFVPEAPVASSGYVELNNTNMPVALVEVGFHDNPRDAAAMKTIAFQQASMKGVAKGLEQHYLGRTACTPLKVTSVTSIVIPFNTVGQVALSYEGYPEFGVSVTAQLVSCAANWTCPEYGSAYYGTQLQGPLSWYIECRGFTAVPATHVYRSWLTDVDGVKSLPIESSITCSATGQASNVEIRDNQPASVLLN